MRFASFRFDGQDTYGVALADTGIVDLKASTASDVPEDLLAFIESGETGLEMAASVIEDPASAVILDVEQIEWHPPVRRPGKICGVAMNNSASNERKISAPDHPAYFLKPASCLIGHKQAIEIRSYYGSVHPEPELAVVIGRVARDVDAGNAAEHIFGYTIFDDFTGNGMRSEDLFQYYALYSSELDPDKLERREQHLSYAGRYKGTDNFGAMGPWLVTRDEIPDPDNLRVTCKVGGAVVAEDSTRYYNYKVAEIVSFISQFQTLQPGDVVSCGTAFKPSTDRKSIHHANLQEVDGPVEVSIEGLGTQETAVARKQAAIGDWRLKS
jgi:2-keto-4-pentenoate hydratase/2-oxohepta-3-ene-1,7-dioic acid hydratase in catechol pathway